MDTSKQLLCLFLHARPCLGLAAIEPVLSRFASVQDFCNAPDQALLPEASPAVNRTLRALCREADSGDAWQQALRWQDQLQRAGIDVLCPDDPEYPELLRELPDRPGAIYVRGDTGTLALPQIAIVGSRNAGRSGLQLASSFSRELAAAGFVISSGLALGIDGEAHKGALSAPGGTIAVLGSGVDRIYPQRHCSLAEEVSRQGALVSEFPLATPPLPHHFPMRNRILAGMSLGTLVIEAATRSGSLITARLALDYNREVFAVPGSVHNPNSKGCHQLIRDGAKLVETAEHIVEELGGLLQLLATRRPEPASTTVDVAGLDSHLAKLLDAVDYQPTAFDTLVARSGLNSDRLAAYLLELELTGWLESCSGSWQRIR
jgi:DNA processing protein